MKTTSHAQKGSKINKLLYTTLFVAILEILQILQFSKFLAHDNDFPAFWLVP